MLVNVSGPGAAYGARTDIRGNNMRPIIAALGALALAATPAIAAEITIEFASDAGAVSYTFDDAAGTFTSTAGASGTYTYDEATKTICGKTAEGELCATFEDDKREVGHSTSYTGSDGGSGTATITAMKADEPAGS